MNRDWCMECFTCAGCDIRLDKIGYIEENDQPYCNKCYELSCAYPCAKCGKKIVGVSKKLFAQEVTNQWDFWPTSWSFEGVSSNLIFFRISCMHWTRNGIWLASVALSVESHSMMEYSIGSKRTHIALNVSCSAWIFLIKKTRWGTSPT